MKRDKSVRLEIRVLLYREFAPNVVCREKKRFASKIGEENVVAGQFFKPADLSGF